MRNALLLSLFIAMLCGACKNSTTSTEAPIDLLNLVDSLDIPTRDLSILIDKQKYELAILYQGQSLKTYPVVLGGNPIDAKRMEGDKCTPEGTFKVRDHYPHKSWTHFIWFDYPNEQSYKDFEEAKRKGQIPQEATIGGEVGIHGVPEGKDYLIDDRINWTLGCIALKTAHIQELSQVVRQGTRIVII